MTNYELPRVWSAADSNQGKFSGINRPTAGSRLKTSITKRRETLPIIFFRNSKRCKSDDFIRRVISIRNQRSRL